MKIDLRRTAVQKIQGEKFDQTQKRVSYYY